VTRAPLYAALDAALADHDPPVRVSPKHRREFVDRLYGHRALTSEAVAELARRAVEMFVRNRLAVDAPVRAPWDRVWPVGGSATMVT
jgi:hypothetical protein